MKELTFNETVSTQCIQRIKNLFARVIRRFLRDKLTFVLTGVLAYKMYSQCFQVNPSIVKEFEWYQGIKIRVIVIEFKKLVCRFYNKLDYDNDL